MKLFCSSIICFLCFSQLLGQLPTQTRRLLFRTLTVEDNLTSQNSNDYIYRDSKGYIWISSITGLNIFDGSIVRQFRPNMRDTTSLSDPNIQSRFFEDREGNIWFSTPKAIQCYNRTKGLFRGYSFDSTFLARESLPELVYLDSVREVFWLTTENGLYTGNLSDPQHLVLKDSLSGISGIGVRTFPYLNGEGTVLFIPKLEGWEIRMYKTGDAVNQSFSQQFGTYSTKSYTAHFESPEIILIGTDTGLVYLDIPKRSLHLVQSFNDQEITKIVGIHTLDVKNRLLVTQQGKFFIFDTRSRRITDQWSIGVIDRNTPVPAVIRQSYLDKEQNLWLSTPGQGIYYTQINKWKFPGLLGKDLGNEEPPFEVRSMAEDSSGNIWCLSVQGVKIVNPATSSVTTYDLSPEEFEQSFGDNPLHINIDFKDRVWIGSTKGLFVRSSRTNAFRNITEKNFPRLLVTQVHVMRSGRILVSTDKGIGEIIESKQGPSFQIIPEKHNKKGVHTLMYETRDKRLWVSKWEENIQLFHQSSSGRLSLDTLLPFTPMINGWIEDRLDSTLWIASSQGLFKLSSSATGYDLQADTLFPVETLNGIIEDEAGYLWMSSSQGLLRYDKEGTVNRFGYADGLKNLQFLFWSFLKARDGQFFFGGTNGINFFYPEHIQLLNILAHPTISELWINDTYYQSIKLKSLKSSPLVFRYNQNTLSFFFTAREYSDPEKNKFKFKMSGVDEDFVELSKGNFVRYPNLPHGVYEFQLMASNSDGLWSKDIYSLYFRILPPWYKTWYFRLSLFVLIVGTLWALIYNRLSQIKKEAYLNQLVAETETAVLRLQMNPHFIFNSLNSVQNSLSNKDEEKANQILKKFIPLMRKILEHSEKPFIAIVDEIKLLEQYLMIESIRFEDKLDFQFSVDPQIDPYEMMVPTMILQPFVENAVKHGISGNKIRKGKIEICFEPRGKGLLCIVRDNGIGREETQRDTTRKKEYRSKATEITERRLGLLKNQEDYPAELRIIDLTSENGDSLGTEVQLDLPLIL
ncbi:MAG: histidine kinase [Bacteroidota bacterium]